MYKAGGAWTRQLLVADHLGSTVATGVVEGGPHNLYRYGPFGEPDYAGAEIRLRFAAAWFDPDTQLNLMGARWYSPWLGRFLSPDPIGDADGPNLYAYVGNDPINLVDPTGMFGEAAGGFGSTRQSNSLFSSNVASSGGPSWAGTQLAACVPCAAPVAAAVAPETAAVILGALGFSGSVAVYNEVKNNGGGARPPRAGADTYGTPPGGPNDPNSRYSRSSGPVLQTDSQARAAARSNGWQETNYTYRGAKVFSDTRTGRFYVRDLDGHSAGAWKGSSTPTRFSPSQRMGTYDMRGTRIGK